MAKASQEMVINLPWDFIDSSAGVAFDIGDSVIKIVYLHNDDWVEPGKRTKGSTGRVRLLSFTKEDAAKAFTHIKPIAHVMRKSPSDVIDIYTTGVGSAQFAKAIKDKMNVESVNVTYLDCQVQGFLHILKNMPRQQMLHELHKPVFEAVKKEYDQWKAFVGKMKDVTSMNVDASKVSYSFSQPSTELSDKIMYEEKDVFPCMLMTVGTSVGCNVVNKDGTFLSTDGSSRGGGMFLGLGSLLTGSKGYDDLMAYCEKGQNRNVSVTNLNLTEGAEKDDKDVYQMIGELDEFSVSNFGKSKGKAIGDFKKEDLARCHLEATAQDLVQVTHNAAKAQKVNHVFFSGGFAVHPLIRKLILTEWLRRDTNWSFIHPEDKPCQAHFLKQGHHVGALGAFLNSKLKFSQK